MPKFSKCDKDVYEMAQSILDEFESHKPLIECKVRVDLVFAFADVDEETGEKLNDALTHQGRKAHGVARKLATKDRAMGRGDVEVCLDGDYWKETASEEMQRALLDHELHHFAVKTSKGQFCYDDLGRPVIRLRKHDVEVGWFGIIADRHGKHSQEQIQAKTIMDAYGQFYWPALAPTNSMAVVKS